MEFVEQPLSYEEPRLAVNKFERTYKALSGVVFSSEGCNLNISSEALFDWKSCYDFVSEVDRRLMTALTAQPLVENVIYASNCGSEAPLRSSVQRKRASLCVAA